MASEIDQPQTPMALEDRRKQAEENKEKRKAKTNKPKCSVKKKDKIENNYDKDEEEYDTITDEEIKLIKEEKFSIRMPDMRTLLPEDHFINVYAKYASNSTESYYEYHVMNAFWLLSTYAKRRSYTRTEVGIIRPNIWVTNIGYSTISGRTSAYTKAIDVYEKVYGERLTDKTFSLEGYYCELRDHQGADGIVWYDLGRDEAGTFYAIVNKTYNEGFFGDACNIYDGNGAGKRLSDGKDGQERSTHTGKTCTTELVNMTPQDLTDYLKVKNVKKGYGLRRLYTFPSYKKEIKGHRPHTKQDDIEFENIINCFGNIRKRFIVKPHSPEEPDESIEEIYFVIEPEAFEYYNKIDIEMKEKFSDGNKYETILGAWGRYTVYALKLALLIEFGKSEYRDTISLESMKIAFKLIIEYFLPTFKLIVDFMEDDQAKNNVKTVLYALKMLGGIASKQVLMREAGIPSRQFFEAIDTLKESESIDVKVDEKNNVMIILKTDDDRRKEEENLPKDKENILDKLRKKGNCSVWNDIKNNSNLNKTRFDKAIECLVFERKIKIDLDDSNTKKPRKIISLIN